MSRLPYARPSSLHNERLPGPKWTPTVLNPNPLLLNELRLMKKSGYKIPAFMSSPATTETFDPKLHNSSTILAYIANKYQLSSITLPSIPSPIVAPKKSRRLPRVLSAATAQESPNYQSPTRMPPKTTLLTNPPIAVKASHAAPSLSFSSLGPLRAPTDVVQAHATHRSSSPVRSVKSQLSPPSSTRSIYSVDRTNTTLRVNPPTRPREAPFNPSVIPPARLSSTAQTRAPSVAVGNFARSQPLALSAQPAIESFTARRATGTGSGPGSLQQSLCHSINRPVPLQPEATTPRVTLVVESTPPSSPGQAEPPAGSLIATASEEMCPPWMRPDHSTLSSSPEEMMSSFPPKATLSRSSMPPIVTLSPSTTAETACSSFMSARSTHMSPFATAASSEPSEPVLCPRSGVTANESDEQVNIPAKRQRTRSGWVGWTLLDYDPPKSTQLVSGTYPDIAGRTTRSGKKFD
jgi:hypothetical protein